MEPKRLWGVMGRMGAGKDAVTDYLQEQGWYEIGMGDIIREIAAERGIEPARDNLDKIQNEYAEKYGRGFLGKIVCDKVKESEYENVVVNGLRRPEDVSELGNEYDNALFIGVDADPEIRFERMAKRGRVGDPKTYEDFLKMDDSQNRIFGMDEAFGKTDVVIYNNGTLEDLRKKVDKLLNN